MKYASIIALGFLLITSQPVWADDTEDPTGVTALLCKMSSNGQVLSQTLSVDYDRKLVDGISANFSPSTITWTFENGSKTEHYELDRITGAYYSWGDNETRSNSKAAFACVKAQKKF